MTAPMNSNDVARNLLALARDLDQTVQQIEHAEREAVDARHDADLARDKAFLAASGSVESRKAQAFVETERLDHAAEVTEAVVRHLKRRIAALGTRIDVGRSYGAAVRAELQTLGVRE